MKGQTCYSPVTGIDDTIAYYLNGGKDQGPFNKYRIAGLRAIYDDAASEQGLSKLTDTYDSVEGRAKELSGYFQRLRKSTRTAIITGTKQQRRAFKGLKRNFSASEMHNRVNMITRMVMDEADNVAMQHPNKSRKKIYQGFTVGNIHVGGQFNFFESVYDRLLRKMTKFEEKAEDEQYSEAQRKEYAEKAQKYRKMLEPETWAALCVKSRGQLLTSEGLKLGIKEGYAEYTTDDGYDYENSEDLYDAEESNAEHWQENEIRKSAFGSIGRRVRRYLSSIRKYESTTRETDSGDLVISTSEVKDDLGFPVFLDPVEAHRKLIELFSGISSSKEIIGRLLDKNGNPREAWLAPIVADLKAHPELVSDFYVDFKKNYCSYTKLIKEKTAAGFKYYVYNLNKVKHNLYKQFLTRIGKNSQPLSTWSVYRADGTVNWHNLQKARKFIKDWLEPSEVAVTAAAQQEAEQPSTPENNEGGIFSRAAVARRQRARKRKAVTKFYDKTTSSDDKAKFLVEVSSMIGVDLTIDEAYTLLRNQKLLRKYTDNLMDLVEWGIEKVFTKDYLNKLEAGTLSDNVQYEALVERAAGKTSMKEKINKLLDTIAEVRGVSRAERFGRYKNRRDTPITVYSDVTPSYMGDRFDEIKAYVQANDHDGLRDWVEKNFLESSFFYDSKHDKILNKWVEALYMSAMDKNTPLTESFAGNFTYDRNLGSGETVFENFTSKQHAISMLTHFFDRGKSEYCKYPVFIMGDAGASKYIRATFHSLDTIVDYMYDVYQQEKARMKQVKAFDEWLETQAEYDTGIKGYKYSGMSGNGKEIKRFKAGESEYTFLTFLNYNDPKYGNEFAIDDNATESEVKDAIRRYLKKAAGEFKARLELYGVLETNKDGSAYTHLADFGITPANIDQKIAEYFYNTKFATIEQLQMMTLDPSFYGSSEDLQKRYKEIHAPGLPIDIYAVDTYDKDHYGQRVSDGIERAIYFDDIKINAERTNPEFMAAVESRMKKSKAYKAYMENTLTDGQTYRNLDSFRALEIMSREWNEDKEAAYREIKQIRRKGTLSAKDIDRLSKLAVTLMPKKPYLFTHERIKLNSGEVMYIPVQHKCSEAVLIPELLPEGSLLRALAVSLEKKGPDGKSIDIAVSSKVIKVGAFGSTKFGNLEQYDDIIRAERELPADAEVTLQDRMDKAVSMAYVHKLEYNDYRIQTNVPEHIHSSRLFGTQVRKLMMSGVIKYNRYGQVEEDDKKPAFASYTNGEQVNLGGRRGKVNLTGRNLVAYYNALIVGNILDSQHDFEEGISSAENVGDMLIQGCISSGRESQDNIIAYGTEDGKFGLPLVDFGLEHDTGALLLSTFKKLVNKQTINGGSAVQESPFGIQDSREDGGLSYIAETEDGREVHSEIVGDDEVKFFDNDGNEVDRKKIVNIKYAQAEVPFDFKYIDADGNERSLEYSEYCNVDGSFILGTDGKTPKIEEEFPGILDIVTYRIPSEKEYSMINVKVVRCSPKLCGGTIKVPAQGTTIAGFDFDIDKLYFMRKEFIEKPSTSIGAVITRLRGGHKKEWLAYDRSKSPLEQHRDRNIARALRNNELLNLIRHRLMDPETFESRYTPQGFEDSKEAARIMRDLQLTDPTEYENPDGTIDFDTLYQMAENSDTDPRPNYDVTDPDTIITYNQQNQVAAKLIGVFANQNANYAFSTLMKKFTLKKAIEFAGHTAAEGFGMDLLHSPEGRDSSRTVAEFLAAAVDAVKDPVLNYLNLNVITGPAGAMLARLGYNPTEIGLLFNQPIIKEACERVFNEGITISEAISNLSSDYLNKGTKDLPKAVGDDLSMNALGKAIVKSSKNPKLLSSKEDPAFVTQQLKVLELFNRIMNASSELTDFINTTRFTAANSVGSTFGALYAQQYRVKKYLEGFNQENVDNPSGHEKESRLFTMEVSDFDKLIEAPIDNNQALLSMDDQEYLDYIVDNPFGYEQAMYDMNRRAIKELSKYFPYETQLYKDLRNRFSDLVRFSNMPEDLINSIHRDMISYLLSRQGYSLFNPSASYPNSNITVGEYYGSSNGFISNYMRKLRENPELLEHPMIKALELTEGTPDPASGHQTFYLNIPDSTYFKAYQKDEIKDAWEDLMKVDKQLAMDLFFYCYHKNGFNFIATSFLHLAPTALKEAIPVPSIDNPDRTYKDFLEELNAGRFDANLEDFAVQYIRNHHDDKNLVYNIKNPKVEEKLREAGLLQDPSTQRTASSITIDLDSPKLKNATQGFVIKDAKEKVKWVPAIKIGGILYVAQSGMAHFNVSSGRSMTYVKVSILGKENVSTTYEGVSGETAIGGFTPYHTPMEQEGNGVINPFSEEGRRHIETEEEARSLIVDGFDYTEFANANHISKRDVINAQANRESILSTAYNVLGEAGQYNKGTYITNVLYDVALALGHITNKTDINNLLIGLSANQKSHIWSELREFFETSDNVPGEFIDKVRELFPSFQGFIGDIYRENSTFEGSSGNEEPGYTGVDERNRDQESDAAVEEALDRLSAAIAALYDEASSPVSAEEIKAQLKQHISPDSTSGQRMTAISTMAANLRRVCRDSAGVPMLDENGELKYGC